MLHGNSQQHIAPALVELTRRGTMTAVAEELGYTASAVSQQLARLEEVVGQPLMVRVGRGVRLTDAGRVLAGHAQGLLRAEGLALAAARAAATQASGSVTVGVFGSTAGALLVPLMLRMAVDHPGVTVLSKEVPVDDSAAAVERGDVDVAFGVDYPLAPMSREPNTELVRLHSERFGLAVPDSWAVEDEVGLSAAEQWPWILTPAPIPFGRAVRAACRSAGFEPHVVHELTDTAVSVLLPAAGSGSPRPPR
jgi:DNA-binding transcriptional LysR family regulator